MTSLKLYLTGLFLLLVAPAFAQSTQSVFLKWKLKPGEVISYKTIMQELDTADYGVFNFDGMKKLMGDSTNASSVDQIQSALKQINKDIQQDSLVTYLTESKPPVIDITMRLGVIKRKPVTDSSELGKDINYFRSFLNKISGGATLRGAIYEDGRIESFYTKNAQRNLIATFFELPGKTVKVGDSWSLDVHFIAMDATFVCDSAYRKNIVKVTGIDYINGETIVQLKYDIDEYVVGHINASFVNDNTTKSSMEMSYKGIASFSLERGRWVNYEGIMALISTGLMSSRSIKKIALIEN